MAKLRLSPAARRDLVEIRVFSIEQFGRGVAETYFRGFNEAFALLRRHPLSGQSAPDVGENIRRLSHRSHRIYYSFGDDAVLIVRIVHKARDAAPLLN